jgi:SAM-dependent methyltransferase
MSDDYAALAPIYDQLGMSQFAETMTPELIVYAQTHDWVGRRAVDLGCGTGASARWLATHGYNTTGIDLSPAMLDAAARSIDREGLGLNWQQGDIRALDDLHHVDVALALDTLNDLNSLRDLEAVFSGVFRMLDHSKLFIFDLHTIEGLAQHHQTSRMAHDSDDLVIFEERVFDFDRQALSSRFAVFERTGDHWRGWRAAQVKRGFPVSVVSALLGRAGFGIMALLNVRLQAFDPASMRTERVIVCALKP